MLTKLDDRAGTSSPTLVSPKIGGRLSLVGWALAASLLACTPAQHQVGEHKGPPRASVAPIRAGTARLGVDASVPPSAEPALSATPAAPPAEPGPLEMSPFEAAVVRWGATQPASPLFLIAHGAGGQAEWHCQHYAAMLGPDCTLVCMRGKRMVTRDPARGYYFPNHHALAEEIAATRAALVQSHASRVALNSAVYMGYSQGATMGVLAVAEHGDWWPRLLLVEGGYDSWSSALARQFAVSGGQRVLFVCGTEHCRSRAQASQGLLERAHVKTKLLAAPGAGHRADGPVGAAVRRGLRWLLDGDSVFEGVHRVLATDSSAEVTSSSAANHALLPQ